MTDNNRYQLHHSFSQNGLEVDRYLNRVYVNSINYYHRNYWNHLELTNDFNQDAEALSQSFRYLEDYLFYYDHFYPNQFSNIFQNLQKKLDVITVLPKQKRGLYGEFQESKKTVFIHPNLQPSASLTGAERTRLYMCHELGHIINSDWMHDVVKQISKSGEQGEILQLMYDGFSLLDEATTQNRAEAITYYFSSKKRSPLRYRGGKLFDGDSYKTNFDFYGELQEPASVFSKTLRGSGGKTATLEDAMRKLSIRTLDSQFVNQVFYEYKKDGYLSSLYTMLAYLGIIKNASYASFGMGEKHYISESRAAKEEFEKMATPLFDSRLPYQY